jgi:two-component system, sensor histidine kinase YesM
LIGMKETNVIEKLQQFRNKLSIKRKLLLFNMVIAVVPVLIFGLLSTRLYEDAVEKRTRQSVKDTSLVIADRISGVLQDAENCSNYLTVNINQILEKQNMYKKITLSQQKSIENELYVGKIVFSAIESIAFVAADESVYVSDTQMLIASEALFASSQYDKLIQTSGKSIWFPCEERDFLVLDSETKVLTMGKKVVQIHTGRTLGYLFINLDMSVMEKNLTNQLVNYYLLDEEGAIVSSVISSTYLTKEELLTEEELLEQENKTTRIGGRTYYISTQSLDKYKWKLIGITDLDELNVEAKKIVYLIMVIAFAAIFLEFVLSNYLSKMITAPLAKLKSGAEEIAGGNMKLRFHFKSEDEIGQLGKSFNYMSQQVEELLAKVDYEAGKKKEYELSLLQEQVKPHFLYNSLDVIIKLSEMNRHKQAQRSLRKLADYYRNSLSDSKEIIPIRQEIKIVEDYLELQKLRYLDLFTYEVQLEEEILNMPIPKLTLQPLVENAIYHGLKYRTEPGLLKISGQRNGQLLILSVEDNGIGMSEEIAQELLENNPEGHFGVYSVNHRIKLYFGENYGIRINSEQRSGTKIDIVLPNRTAEEEGDS